MASQGVEELAEEEIDEIFSQLPEVYEVDTPGRFAKPVSDSEVKEAQAAAVPQNTRKATNWSVNVWKEWCANRQTICGSSEVPPHLLICTVEQLAHWLSKFVLEARRTDGKSYPPNTLYQLVCGIQRYVREVKPELDLHKDAVFACFRKTLDAEMKRLRGEGLGVKSKQAEAISEDEEEQLWASGCLGEDSPAVLLDTMVYMCGLYFALRSGKEHRQLTLKQIELVELPGCEPYLVYYECVSKNNAGGLQNRKVKPKQVIHHANTTRPERCFVRLFKVYCSHRPTNPKRDPLYLQPISNPQSSVWYARSPVGQHKLDTTVARLCARAGIGGYKTNHSLRVTNATRLFQKGVDEQLIMARTGHRSIDGIRAYKRVSTEQQRMLSDILNGNAEQAPAKKMKFDNNMFEEKENLGVEEPITGSVAHPVSRCTEKENIETPNVPTSGSVVPCSRLPGPGSPALSFSGCSGITINYRFGQ